MKFRKPTNGLGQGSDFKTTVLATLFVLTATINRDVNGDPKYTDYCLSVNRELGKCVPLKSCPLFLEWVRQRPIVKSNLRQVVKFTCYFDLNTPKVCCPVTEIDKEPNLITDKSAFNDDILRGVSVRRLPKPTSQPDLLFPSDNPEPERKRKQKLRQFNKFQLLPELKDCSNSIRLARLVGSYGTQPWIALIGSINPDTGKFEHSCTGTIINRNHILTSAHCPYESSLTITHIRVGDYDIDTDIDRGSIYLPQSTYREYKIQKIIPHLGFDKIRRINDIAIIRVDQDIDFTSIFIRPICLPFSKEYGLSSILKLDDLNEIVDKKALVAGWGKTTWNSGPKAPVLKEAAVQFSPYEECENAYGTKLVIQSKQICVGGQGRKNSCIVDSGGPLLIPVKVNATRISGFLSAKMFQLGILSLGPSSQHCNNNEMPLPPSVYTKVSSYLDWIVNSLEP